MTDSEIHSDFVRALAYYQDNCSKITPDVFLHRKAPGCRLAAMTPAALRFYGYRELLEEDSGLDKFTNDLEGCNKERFWRSRHKLFTSVVTRWLKRDQNFQNDEEAKVEWTRFCGMFDNKTPDLSPVADGLSGYKKYLRHKTSFRRFGSPSNWSLWWLMIPAIVIFGAHVLNRHVQRHLSKKHVKNQKCYTSDDMDTV